MIFSNLLFKVKTVWPPAKRELDPPIYLPPATCSFT